MSDTPKRKPFFTRHLLRAGLECPAKLFYYANHYPQDREIWPFLEHAGRNRKQLKKLLRTHYPKGTLIDESDFKSACRKTREQIKNDKKILFDAVFIHRRKVAVIPVFIKDDQQVALHFVQTKSINPQNHRLVNSRGKLYKKWSQYIYNAAFQTDIIREIYPEWEIRSFISLPDKTATATASQLYKRINSDSPIPFQEKLFACIDISNHVNSLLNGSGNFNGERSFKATVEHLRKQYLKGAYTSIAVGLKCRNCEFRISDRSLKQGKKSGFNMCWSKSEAVPDFAPGEPHVFDMIGPGVSRWINKGIYLQKDIYLQALPDLKTFHHSPEAFTLKQRQTLQVRHAKGLETPSEIIKKPIFDEINRWEYPLHFLDFEAGNYAVPMRRDRRPYHLVVFQFSCHTLREDGSLHHTGWLSETGGPYPGYEMVRRLMQVKDIEKGTIIQYSNFERRALKKIYGELQNETEEIADAVDLIAWLKPIIRRSDSNGKRKPYLADLSRLVRNYYYNKYMADSLSVKDVVQSVLTLGDWLKQTYREAYHGSNFNGMQWWQWDDKRQRAKNPYRLLRALQPEVKVGRGTEAMIAFGKIIDGSLEGKSKAIALQSLRRYCELDTLAMVIIYQHWRHLAGSA